MLTFSTEEPSHRVTSHFAWDAFLRVSERLGQVATGSGEAWLLTGLEGAGKTTLLDETLPNLSDPMRRIVRVSVRHTDQLDLAGFAARALGTVLSRNAPTGEDLDRLTEFLAGPDRSATLLVVDGAHAIRAEVARYIQFAWASAPHLQIVFAARPGFRDLIDRTEFAYLRSRLGPELAMPRLSDDEAVRYVGHTLTQVGASPDRLFADGAVEALVREGQGLPGRLNKLQEVAIEIGIMRTDKRVTPVSILQASAQMSQTQREMTEAPPERVSFGRASPANALMVIPQPSSPRFGRPVESKPTVIESSPPASRRRFVAAVPLALLAIGIVGAVYGVVVWMNRADLADASRPNPSPATAEAPISSPEPPRQVAAPTPPVEETRPPVVVAAPEPQTVQPEKPPKAAEPVQLAKPAPVNEPSADDAALAQARAEYFRQAAALGDAAAKRAVRTPAEAGAAPR